MRNFFFVILSLTIFGCDRRPEKLSAISQTSANSTADETGKYEEDAPSSETVTPEKELPKESPTPTEDPGNSGNKGEEKDETPAFDPKLYAFDGAFPLAAALMGTSPKVDTGENHPMGWGEANIWTVIFDYMYVSDSREYAFTIDKVYEANVDKGWKNFKNEFFDDTAWWGLAWIRAYDLTGDARYLNTAKEIAAYIYSDGWSKNCGGGIRWKREGDQEKSSKNAIATGLYMKLVASLHNRIKGDTQYLALAKQTFDWFIGSDLIYKDTKVFADAVDPENCTKTGGTFTYNQGLVLGAAAELFKATKDNKYKEKGQEYALAAIKYFSNGDGILYEKSRTNDYDCRTGSDNIWFRGAFLRNLRELNELVNDASISSYISKNADFVWNKARNQYDATNGCWEKGKTDKYDASYITVGLDLMNAAIPQKRKNLAKGKKGVASADACTSGESPQMATDGSASTKWCSKSKEATLDIPLGGKQFIHRVRILHAGAGALMGDSKDMNTKDFEILTSDSEKGPWVSAAKVAGNMSSGTSNLIDKSGSFVRIKISNPGSDGIIRIYEVMVE